MTIIIQILGVAIGFGFLVFIHELGHFLTARACKVRVLTFAFGFGPDLIKHTHNGTKYAIKAIPFGGFVAMAGENPQEATGSDDEYLSLKWYKKILISFAGPFSNYILAVFLFMFVFSIWGFTTTSETSLVGSVKEGESADQAGLMPGDKIKLIDGVEVNTWHEMMENLKNKADKQAIFIVERGTYTFGTSLNVGKNPVTGAGIIGISPAIEKSYSGFFESFYLGTKSCIEQTVITVGYLIDKLISFEKPELSGPIGIMRLMGDKTKTGAADYLKFLAIISVALGMFNLFPIPMVDGGMIVLFFIEGIIRRQISTKVVQIYNTIGLFFILGIFIFATYSDLLRLGIHKLFSK
ncbi:MAG: site-2 protease family protein [Endomicrobium sp.]|jgi:regulator of sigma E protease|nr:site-2 protease family protein [Endomicrobium sp.]